MPRERIAGVVLAAGLSSRMGTNKMLLRLGGTSVVRRAVSTALEAGLDPVVVVLGHEGGRIRAELEGLPCTPVENADYAQGMNTSLRAGIRALPEDVEGAVVLLGDMPLVDASMLRSLADRFHGSRPKLLVSTYGDVLAPPILYGRPLFEELRALDEKACGKSVVKRHRGEAVELAWPAERLSDLDVPEDLHRIGLQCAGASAANSKGPTDAG
ncbi:MAG TPA: nucleotidyltransferase family protein [Myxococcales bacterium]